MKHLLKEFDVFIFDWDGTLATLGPIYALNEKFSPLWKYKKKKYSETREIKKMNYNIKTRIRERKIEGKLFARFVDLYFAVARPRLQRDSRSMLELLKKKGKTVCLFTNGATWRIEKELTALGLKDFFEIIISAQEIKAIKPNPIGLNIIIKELRAERERTLYTGDMVDDIMMAKYAKVHSCAIADGFSSYEKLKATKPDYLFRTMEEFKRFL